VNHGAGRDVRALPPVSAEGPAARRLKGLTALGGEVKGGRNCGLTQAPYGEDGIDDRGRERDRLGESRSSRELNGRRMRGRIADDAAVKVDAGVQLGTLVRPMVCPE